MKSYTSEVSPDRKGIITSGLKAVSGNRQTVLKPIDFVATLLEGKAKYQKLPSGNSDYIEFYDKMWIVLRIVSMQKHSRKLSQYATEYGRAGIPGVPVDWGAGKGGEGQYGI